MGELADKLSELSPERRLYTLQTLPAHLSGARQKERLEQVLTTFDFLQAKVDALDPQALIEDYESTNEHNLRLIQGALQMSAHVLSEDPKQLAGQLLGRLMKWETPQIQAMLEQVKQEKITPWLRPLSQSLPSAGGPLLRTLTGYTEWVTGVAVTPDGRHMVSASGTTIRVVDLLASGTDLFMLKGHTSPINAVVVTPDGRRVISAAGRIGLGEGGDTLKVWDLEHGTELFTLKSHTGPVTAVAVTPDSKRAVSGSSTGGAFDRLLTVWDLERGMELFTRKGHKEDIRAVAVTPDGRHAISAAGSSPYWRDSRLKIWDLERGTEERSLAVREDWVLAVAAMPDGQRVIFGSDYGTLKIWDLKHGTDLLTLEGDASDVTAVAVTPDGHYAISGSDYGTLKIWDLDSGTEMFTQKAHADRITAVAVTLDGRYAVSGSRDQTVKVWDISIALNAGLGRGTRLVQPEHHTDEVTALAVTPDGRHAISGSLDRTFKVWDLERGIEVRTLVDHPDRGGKGPVKRFLRGGDGNSRRRGGNWNRLIAVTPNGRYAVTAAVSLANLSENTLKVWDLENGTLLHTLKGHRDPVEAVATTPDGRHVVSASHDYTLKVWNLKRGRKLRTLRGPNEPFYGRVAVTPDGRLAVSASLYALEVWDLRRRKLLNTLMPRGRQITAMAVAPDGRRAISATLNNTLKVWELENGKDVHTLKGHRTSVRQVAVTPDGCRAVSAAGTEYTYGYTPDNTLKVWDLEHGTELYTLAGHQNNIEALAITPDDQRAVSTSHDRTIKVWCLESGEAVADFTGESEILTCALAPDGGTIVAGEQSGRVHILRVENVIPGPSVVTAWCRPLPRWRRLVPLWRANDPMPAFGCPFCRTWSEVPASALGTELPCPRCGKRVKLNPFTFNADWRPVAKGWIE